MNIELKLIKVKDIIEKFKDSAEIKVCGSLQTSSLLDCEVRAFCLFRISARVMRNFAYMGVGIHCEKQLSPNDNAKNKEKVLSN
jgi:hypothetical protein